MKITVNPLWLNTCGRKSDIGFAFPVTNFADHGKRGKIYEVLDRHGFPWVVWSVRGVIEYNDDMTLVSKNRKAS